MKYIAPKSKDTQAQKQQLYDAINGVVKKNPALRNPTPASIKSADDVAGIPTGSSTLSAPYNGSVLPGFMTDADTLDGYHASAFSQTTHNHTFLNLEDVTGLSDGQLLRRLENSIVGEDYDNLAQADHNHDADYADIAHNHNGDYGRWRGESAVPPEDALSNDVYYNTSNGGTYVYIGFISTWLLIPTDYATAGHNHDTVYHPLGSYCAWLGYLSSEPTGVDGAIYVNSIDGFGYMYVNAAWTKIF